MDINLHHQQMREIEYMLDLKKKELGDLAHIQILEEPSTGYKPKDFQPIQHTQIFSRDENQVIKVLEEENKELKRQLAKQVLTYVKKGLRG